MCSGGEASPVRSGGNEGVGNDASDWDDHNADIADRLERQLRRIALDLHDGPMQALTAARLHTSIIATMADSEECAEECRVLGKELETALHELQGIAASLRPPALDEAGLDEMLRKHIAEDIRECGLVIELDVSGDCSNLSQSAQIAIFRIVQEALNNVWRHSGARRAWVTLRHLEHCVECEVVDDGRGFDPGSVPEARRARLGLRGMHERAELLGGTVDVLSEVGAGTTVAMRIPLWS